jgi:hypothetical protein
LPHWTASTELQNLRKISMEKLRAGELDNFVLTYSLCWETPRGRTKVLFQTLILLGNFFGIVHPGRAWSSTGAI